MTNDRNDRRRRPQPGPGQRPGGNDRPQRPGGNSPSQNPPRRDDSARRGFAPDSGYRPAGSAPQNEAPKGGGRRWSNNKPGNAPAGYNRGGGSGPASPNSGGFRQGKPDTNASRERDGYPPRRGGSNPSRPPERNYRDRGPGAPQGQGQGQPPRGGDYNRRPGPSGYRDSNQRRDSGGRPYEERRPAEDRGPRPPSPPPSRGPAPEPSRRSGKVEPFELFCAYHLGITADKKFRHANLNDVARRFNVGPGEIKQALQDHGMDAAVVMEKEFDMALAQLDIELAPEGIDRVELARQIYSDFLEAPRKKIDWKKIIDEDIRENAKIFGRKD